MPRIHNYLSNLDDFVAAPFESGQSLIYNGQTWTNGSIYLSQLGDVTTLDTTESQLLEFNGFRWVNQPPLAISALADVTMRAPLDKSQVLRYDGTRWTNTYVSLSSLTDVTFATTPQYTELLAYNTGAWRNVAPISVADGGTGTTSIGAYQIVCGGTTDTGSLQTVPLGSAGYIFRSNGVGALPTFVNSNLFPRVTSTFTANGTYVPTAGMVVCVVEMIGGGGGGGGAATGNASVGGGGGAGEYVKAVLYKNDIGASVNIVIGLGGIGLAGPGKSGDGGNTTFGGLLIAHGGIGGTGTTTLNAARSGQAGTGGSGGVSAANLFYISGAPGTHGFFKTATISISGSGGSSIYGSGGNGILNSGGATNGTPGLGYGSGGGGAISLTTSGNRTGGNGASGIVVVSEYIFTS